ncbi:TetR family transcriptional regulator [Bradyrhizobium sp. IC3069]|uniref:AcrR family transcriptional regulator n=1 Tax=Bradyrhizobium yuanmingense TaxID=108015 RepID=A0A1C3WAU2_9BRAD|nr:MULTISPECIES: TetR/AcrR family transcriptional regulator [Bradyrhizobium]MCA1384875.1 TetR family transcriptional regulator [Bradyrhizobium sp. BRP05]MCA1362192.1 TetR family transcriptional regulator [Bradyrhizobium sp. IC4059]MCA1376219.1 TetR family transcriptional regulator [Bradyrhizobium sp. IC4060]MCA1388172.1 TetR family transcriptional regulator [Bradyrhizobium sp. IC3123]MCA1421605.1 TetR family transcriptional regulator [Bradyrhizobium sp. BRP23]
MRAFTRFSYSHSDHKSVARKPSTTPRKNASQERSRATVDALVEATARILVKEGFEKASTNRIAEIAGVSVGSLYQYFPSKEALVAAVIDRHNDAIMNVVRAAFAEVADLPIEMAVHRLVTVAIEAHHIDPNLHRVLAEQIPRSGHLAEVEAYSHEIHALVRTYLERHRKEMRKIDPALAAFMCVSAIEAIAHNTVLNGEMLSEKMVKVLVDETTRMVVGYLR